MWWCLVALFPLLFHEVQSEILTPPYFNLAEGKEIIASATCGVDTPGPELYCKLVGANSDQDENINLIQGQASHEFFIFTLFLGYKNYRMLFAVHRNNEVDLLNFIIFNLFFTTDSGLEFRFLKFLQDIELPNLIVLREFLI